MLKLSARLCMLVSLVLLVGCDHVTKGVAKLELDRGGAVELIRGVVDFHYVENRDVAFNLLRWVPEAIRAPGLLVFGAIAILALGLLLFLGRGEARMGRFGRVALLLVTAGAIGNYLDRVVRGYVVDFVHVHHWPVFNVADIYVTVGYGLLAWGLVGYRRSGTETARASG